jgi:hypothetical protein
MHSSGVNFDGKGLLFVGHAQAGKSTIAKMLKQSVEILCDDRMILRRWKHGFRIHGTWSHGDIPDVSANSPPLKAILFLEKAPENRLVHLNDKKVVIRKILSCLVRPLMTADWWEKMLNLVENIAREVPCYDLYFDKSGKIVDILANELIS